ncbi:MAG: bifunctional glycosyltransferase family 2/GtrA family protein [Candidatus Sulfopaludibacter sp.]|nr:bifunctional glycosyltransferase family 2/GtrA family protein [Candidatus Sulfopaludibacter sp.]
MIPGHCAILIPAYRPSPALIDVVGALSEQGGAPIVLIDDGSGPESADIFARAAAYPGVRLLRHDTNLGKGAALKTGIRFALAEYPDLAGVVTADADGQHHPEDIARVMAALPAGKGASLVLGSRSFQGAVPLRSRIGNVLTRSIMHVLLGCKLRDTQTGLRAIPVTMLPQLLQLESSGYEFELEMLILAHQLSIPVAEEPIRTIYEAGNRSSHFNPLVDSMKIYFVLLRFTSVSLATALLDNLVFYLAYRHSGHVLASQVLGRVLAVAFNYWMVRRSVFYSQQRHLSTLPKYLALVAVSGAASYGGIRLLGASLGIHPVAAKLMVESALFFVNFVVQRMLIFRPSHGRKRHAGGAAFVLLWVIFAAVLGLEVYGFRSNHLFAQEIWHPIGLDRFLRYVRLFVLFSVPMLAFAPRFYIPVVGAVVLVGTTLAAGPLAPAAVLLFLVSACALGCRIVDDELLATLTGTGIFILSMLATARLPVNYPAVWAAVLLLPVALDLRGVSRRFAGWVRAMCQRRTRPVAERAALALLTFILGAHWLVALKPEISADGLAMHLAIPVNMAAHHAMTFQPGSLLWAVMPMGADWAYSIVYLMGGELAARLLNFAMLLALAGLLYAAVRRWLPRAAALLLVALFAASPLVQLVTGSLFVENLLAALLLAMLTAVWRFGDTGNRKFLYAAALLGGAALTTKLAALPFVVLAMPFAALEVRRHWKRVGPAPCLLALLLLLATALPTYAIAWLKTGNPVFPFLNGTFPSPLLDRAAEVRDYRFRRPLTWRTPFDLTFLTSRFYEGQNGSMGFQYLLLAPFALVALWSKRRPAICASVIALAAMTVVLRSEPNARYLYAGLPLLFIPFAALLASARRNRRLLYGALIACAVLCTGIDIWFLPASSWYHKKFYAHYEFRPDGFERYLDEDAPARAVVKYYNREHPNSTMLLVSDNDLADARGTVYENNWHQWDTWTKIQNAVNLPQMIELVDAWKLQYFIGRNEAVNSPDESRGLRQFLAQCTQTELERDGVFLAKANGRCLEVPAAPPVTPGTYDDFDPALRFHGKWVHSDEFPAAWQRTVSYTNTKGAQAALIFDGQGLTYVFTRAPNRGFAELLIDGVSRGVLDLYAPEAQWQSRYRVCCLAPGRHIAVIRALGQARKEATGRFADVDELVVE